MALDDSVPRAREAQEYLHGRVESLDYLTDLLRDARIDHDWDEIEESTREYDRFANAIADYLENEADNLDGNIADLIGEVSMWTGFENYKSPTFNFGVENPDSTGGNYKSPTFNFGSMPDWGAGGSSSSGSNTNILDSWDDYDWSGWEDTGDPEFDTPWDYAESRGVTNSGTSSAGPSISIKYHGDGDSTGLWSEEPDIDFSGDDRPWGGAAS